MSNGHEILTMIDALAREKGIEKQDVLEAIEMAIQKAARGKYGMEYDIRAVIDPRRGNISLTRVREVVEDADNPYLQISLSDAQIEKADAKVGDEISEDLPPLDFGRVAAQTARQVIFQGVKSAEREKQYNEYKDRIGEVINGIVRRVEYGNVIVDLGRAEALLHRNEMVGRESFKPGDRVRAIIMDVRRENRGSQVFLSRTHPDFMAALFTQEVPEIYDGQIVIKGVARDPGSRAKMAVYTADSSIDPVGACVGMRGSRVQAVVNELQGERVDIIPWSEDMATFVVNALVPAEVSKVILDEDTGRVDVVVTDEQLSLAIGRRGQNVRLASKLTGLNIDVVSATQEEENRQVEAERRISLFAEALDVDEMISQLLASEGFASIEDVAYIEVEELLQIEGFDEELAQELQSRAKAYLEEEEGRLTQECRKLGMEKALISLADVPARIKVAVGQKGILTRDDLGDLAGDELVDLIKEDLNLTPEEANDVIMKARAHWFEGAQ